MLIMQRHNRWRLQHDGQGAHARFLAHYHFKPVIRRWRRANAAMSRRLISPRSWVGRADFTFGSVEDAALFKMTFEGFPSEFAT